MASTKGEVKPGPGKPRRSSTTDRELRKLGTAVAKAANTLSKGGKRDRAMVVPLPRCMVAAPWCMPIDPDNPRPPVWIEVKIGRKPPR